MSKIISNETYYRTTEVCTMSGISKGTLFRWIRFGIIPDAEYKDRNSWRLFPKVEVENIRAIANKTVKG